MGVNTETLKLLRDNLNGLPAKDVGFAKHYGVSRATINHVKSGKHGSTCYPPQSRSDTLTLPARTPTKKCPTCVGAMAA